MEKKVMIVDDEQDILTSLKTVLEKNNYEVITATNGYECLREVEKGFKGLILMDLMMPRLDGWNTINEIVQRGYINDVAIAVITGKGTKDFQNMSRVGSYILDYMTKPLDIDRLIASVERCYGYLIARYN